MITFRNSAIATAIALAFAATAAIGQGTAGSGSTGGSSAGSPGAGAPSTTSPSTGPSTGSPDAKKVEPLSAEERSKCGKLTGSAQQDCVRDLRAAGKSDSGPRSAAGSTGSDTPKSN